ncbi:endonuclease V [Gorgonomyces haynaldii]|nr:endonuclease V [Gorgonomyces haynaldii]
MLSIHDYQTLALVKTVWVSGTTTESYEAGFLGYKEFPIYSQLIQQLKQESPDLMPQVFLVDGFGILHHRKAGSATMLGVLLDICTIGIGKSLLHIDGLVEKHIRQEMKDNNIDTMELRGESGFLYGMAYSKQTRPIYVSIGHKISLESSLSIVKHCCLHKIPEPIRTADLQSRQLLAELVSGSLDTFGCHS